VVFLTFRLFLQVLAYFTLCLWCVPFALFISLSANDNVLPLNERSPLLANDVVTNYFSKNRKSGLLSLFSYAKETLLPQRNKKAF
jgi:Transmembrane adaptor Erv26